MAAITLLFRLKRVDLSVKVSKHREEIMLDSIIACLSGEARLRQRTETVLQQCVGLIGGDKVLEELGFILRGKSPRPGAQRGTVVLSAARIIRALIDTDTLTSSQRLEAGQLLREAARDEQHRRPIYQSMGSGLERDPITYKYVGMLHEELARIWAKRTNWRDVQERPISN